MPTTVTIAIGLRHVLRHLAAKRASLTAYLGARIDDLENQAAGPEMKRNDEDVL